MDNKLKILYIANARIPTEKAHGIQIMKMCEAFASLNLKNRISKFKNIEIELVVPKRLNKIKQDPFEYYGVERIFKIKKLPSIDFLFFDFPTTFFLQTITFCISLFFYLLFQKGDYVVYTRGETVLGLSKFCRKPLFWETHIVPKHLNWYKKAIKKTNGLIVVTNAYKNFLIENNISSQKILYVPDGVDFKKFDINITKKEAREKLGLSLDKKIILYAGSFQKWKGVEVLIEATKKFDDNNIQFVFVGKTKENSKLKNTIFVGHKPYEQIPLWLKAADILVLTGTAKSRISRYYTSPLKMFEYMASQRPIIAPRIPSFLDILNDNNSFLIEPDSPKALAEKINFILQNPAKVESIPKNAHEEAQQYDWKKRAEKIVDFIKLRITNSKI